MHEVSERGMRRVEMFSMHVVMEGGAGCVENGGVPVLGASGDGLRNGVHREQWGERQIRVRNPYETRNTRPTMAKQGLRTVPRVRLTTGRVSGLEEDQ